MTAHVTHVDVRQLSEIYYRWGIFVVETYINRYAGATLFDPSTPCPLASARSSDRPLDIGLHYMEFSIFLLRASIHDWPSNIVAVDVAMLM
jgi:hypothetical protein